MAPSQSLEGYENKTLYHGSYTPVRTPDLEHAREGKDFGRGFYLTSGQKQAEDFARIVSRREKDRTPMLNRYRLSGLDGLHVKIFAEMNFPSLEWLEMIACCRGKKHPHPYDLVIGPAADDAAARIVQFFLGDAYGPCKSRRAQEMAAGMFAARPLAGQVIFCTEKALERLEYLDTAVLKERAPAGEKLDLRVVKIVAVTAAVDYAAEELKKSRDQVLRDFILSDTFRLIQDDSTRMWAESGMYLGEWYLDELHKTGKLRGEALPF